MLTALNDSTLLLALGYLIAFLTTATIFAKWKTKHQPLSTLRDQINAWWVLIPILWITLMFFPFSLFVLLGLISWLTLRELRTYWQQKESKPSVCIAFCVTIAGLSCLFSFQNLSNSTQQDIRWLFYLFLLTGANDVLQFIFGKLFGRHLIAPNVSPNKTWEGLLGGVIFSSLLSLAMGIALTPLTWPLLLALGGILAVIGFAGDLFYSFIKRRLSIKDFSTLIKGHGGILDRVDSLVFTTPALYLFLSTFIYPKL